IKDYVKNDFQARDKDIQRKQIMILSYKNKRGRQFVDDNIEDFYTKGWFNELIQEGLIQIQLWKSKSSQFENCYQRQIQQYFQKMKTNQNIQNQLSNIKIQYQKVKNLIANIQDNQSMNNNSELYKLDKPNMQVQQKSFNNFQPTFSAFDEFSQSPHAFNLNKKVQFSINLLQEKNEDNQGDNKSIQVQSSQFINHNNIPISFHHYQTIV
ncbi:hypothetical protein ABPG73_016948, partial [Tetrahymena malaccensis]